MFSAVSSIQKKVKCHWPCYIEESNAIHIYFAKIMLVRLAPINIVCVRKRHFDESEQHLFGDYMF